MFYCKLFKEITVSLGGLVHTCTCHNIVLYAGIRKRGEVHGPDRTNTLIHGTDRTVEGVVVGVV